MELGFDGIWNDMNEPATFDGVKSINNDCIHLGYNGPHLHEKIHNIYGMLMAASTLEGLKKLNPNKRPFVLTRSNFLGGQKYAATWTGDNSSHWLHLKMSIPMILNLGLSGQPNSGPDIGGFGNNATPKLFARWMGFGALLPFARGHTHLDTNPHEPYEFGEECEETCRIAINRRYMLIPYIYTLFRESSISGAPVARPVFF